MEAWKDWQSQKKEREREKNAKDETNGKERHKEAAHRKAGDKEQTVENERDRVG